jgi:hypothetical protein
MNVYLFDLFHKLDADSSNVLNGHVSNFRDLDTPALPRYTSRSALREESSQWIRVDVRHG